MEYQSASYIRVPNLVFCSYWGTLSRVLAGPRAWNDGEKLTRDLVEVNITPINGWDWPGEVDRIRHVRIRRHGTMRGRNDRYCNLLRQEDYDDLVRYAGLENATLILFGDLLSMVDWNKYYKFNNGGADLFHIMRDGICVGPQANDAAA